MTMFTYFLEVSDSVISNIHKTQPHSLLELNKMAFFALKWTCGMEYRLFQNRAAPYRRDINRVHI